MEENDGDASNLLNSLLGQVTEQQKEIYKKIRYEQGGLVISETFTDTESSDEDGEIALDESNLIELTPAQCAIDSELNHGDEVMIDYVDLAPVQPDFTEFDTSRPIPCASGEPIASSSATSSFNRATQLQWDSAIPFKYVNGDISFNELTDLMEKELQTGRFADLLVSDSNKSPTRPVSSSIVIEEGDLPGPDKNLLSDQIEADDEESELEVEDVEEEEENDETNSESDESEWVKAEAFERELMHQSKRKSKSKGNANESSGPTRRKKLGKDLHGLVGQANLNFARHDYDGAITMCLEVIRRAPTAPEPFQTLGMIYEERRDFEKAYQYNLISAYLSPSDGEHWIRVAEMAIEQQQFAQAIICYSKAIKIYPENISLHIERCKLYQKVDDKKKALDGYEQVLEMIIQEEAFRKANMPSNTNLNWSEMGLFIAKEMAKIHYFNGQIDLAIEVMEENLHRFHSHIINEDVNLYLELLINNKQYLKALAAFKVYCGLQMQMDGLPLARPLDLDFIEQNSSRLTVELLFNEMQIDLQAKLAVCLIRLRLFASVVSIERFVTSESATEIGDLYLDIADAYISVGRNQQALPLLKALVETNGSYSGPQVLLRLGRCLSALQINDEAINVYHSIHRQAPFLVEAKLELCRLLMGQQRDTEAVRISSQPTIGEINIQLLLIRCQLLFKLNRLDLFLRSARFLLSSQITFLHRPEQISVMITSTTHKTRIESLKDVIKELAAKRLHRSTEDSASVIDSAEDDDLDEEGEILIGDDDSDSGTIDFRNAVLVGDPITGPEMFEVFLAYCKTLHEKKMLKTLVKTALSAYTCSQFADMEKQLDFVALNACYLAQDRQYSYSLCKAIIFRSCDNNQVWNLFSVIMMRFYQDLRHNKFCLRLFVKHSDNLSLAYINGHNALISGSYKHALAEYMNIHKQNPDDPLAAFCLSLGFTHLICQKFITNRHSVVVQLCAFLNLYLELRGQCQESLYNTGRALHQIGLVSEAVHFYKKALNCIDSIECSDREKDEIFDLRREIAFNLCLIYRNSESPELAMHYMQKYLTI